MRPSWRVTFEASRKDLRNAVPPWPSPMSGTFPPRAAYAEIRAGGERNDGQITVSNEPSNQGGIETGAPRPAGAGSGGERGLCPGRGPVAAHQGGRHGGRQRAGARQRAALAGGESVALHSR